MDKEICVIDVGAHKGDVFKDVLNTGVTITDAYLFEPNPVSFKKLKNVVESLPETTVVKTINLAVGDRAARVKMKDADTMSKIVEVMDPKVSKSKASDKSYFEVDSVRLDDFLRDFLNDNKREKISLLKIDVEGYELEVIEGGRELLTSKKIDVVYIEAGLNPNGVQQTYYRKIEDALNKYGYRLFRIYEQKHEWIDDSPFLRRINMAFFSERFAAEYPYKATKKKYAERSVVVNAGASHENGIKGEPILHETSVLVSKSAIAKQLNKNYRRLESFHWLVNALHIRGRLPYLEGREMAPDALLAVHEYIRQEKPRLVVLIGGEATALVAADALRQNGIGKMIVFDHSQNFSSGTQNRLKREHLSVWCELNVSPLVEWDGEHLGSVQREAVAKNKKLLKWHHPDDFSGISNIDFLVVDGPHGSLCPYARYPALPVLFDKLSPSAEVWLDDTDRSDEKLIADEWAKKYSLDLEFFSNENGLAKLKK
nr:FkbM family methyltransferase [Halomonas malpeensis]